MMTDEKVRQCVTLNNAQGLHLRPADCFVRLACQFSSEIRVSKDGQTVDGKSIIGIVTLAAEHGTQLEIEALGPDARPALAALVSLVEQGFHEE